LILRITTPDDSELAMSSASQLAEAYDGSTLAYQDETRINDEQPKVTRARATRPTPGAGVTLTVEGDSDDVGRKQLPPETIFSAEHSKRLIAAAAAGQGQYSATVVDGTFTKGYVVSAFIAKARPAPRGTYSGPAFPDATVWPVRLGYFPLGEAAGEPEFEASAQIGASGIAAELVIEQAGLKLKATLVGLKLLEPEGC
ncbi:MAG: DUF1849 family protein, partial [Alphaproteobacteria bacterium]|nr:DUF1849 family protein [Alphaproteobacteria bacterium]